MRYSSFFVQNVEKSGLTFDIYDIYNYMANIR